MLASSLLLLLGLLLSSSLVSVMVCLGQPRWRCCGHLWSLSEVLLGDWISVSVLLGGYIQIINSVKGIITSRSNLTTVVLKQLLGAEGSVHVSVMSGSCPKNIFDIKNIFIIYIKTSRNGLKVAKAGHYSDSYDSERLVYGQNTN